MKKIFLATPLFFSIQLFSQDSTNYKLTISGYVEAYYLYDFNKPPDGTRPGFFYNHNRHNEFNLNLGFIKARYEEQKLRVNLALGAGTYMNANYTAEPGVLKNVFEANAGVRIGRKNLWIDAGILPSHLGFESAISKDCWNLTRSILAENSPYFEAGAKVTYTSDNGEWLISGMTLNGWQRITRFNGNSHLSWGMQVQYKPSERILLNYSNFIGADQPDTTRLNRLFHNFYGVIALTNKFGLIAGLDIGTEQKFTGRRERNTWYSPVVILRFLINDQWIIAARGEYYSDKNGVIIFTGTPNGFKTGGFSLNIDHSPSKNLLMRVEARTLQSIDKIFFKENGLIKGNTFLTCSIAASF